MFKKKNVRRAKTVLKKQLDSQINFLLFIIYTVKIFLQSFLEGLANFNACKYCTVLVYSNFCT